MRSSIYYTAIGNMRRITEGPDHVYPVIVINQKEYPVDLQEMAVWTALCWHILDFEQLQERYCTLSKDNCYTQRTLENCVERLKTRGLIVSGSGPTDVDALYDLLAGLYVVPLSRSPMLRLSAFAKLIAQGVPFNKASILLYKNPRPENEREVQVMALSRQALLSTAELIRCVELGVKDVSTDEKLLNALYFDADTTCDNLPYQMQNASSRVPITMAVANLYLSKQIIFERL